MDTRHPPTATWERRKIDWQQSANSWKICQYLNKTLCSCVTGLIHRESAQITGLTQDTLRREITIIQNKTRQ
jgi:hypothetical protein